MIEPNIFGTVLAYSILFIFYVFAVTPLIGVVFVGRFEGYIDSIVEGFLVQAVVGLAWGAFKVIAWAFDYVYVFTL